MKKINKPKITIRSRNDAEDILAAVASSVATLNALKATLDDSIANLRAKAAVDMEYYESRIESGTCALSDWAEANPNEFPKDRRSIDFISGVIGFRTSPPKLSLLNRKWNWEKCLMAVCAHLPNFVRSQPEIDKQALIGQADELAPALVKCGLKVEQGERFFIEPKLS
jgi:phage host-nuclease inhibitor protein Gam